jgi:hypothetical protein
MKLVVKLVLIDQSIKQACETRKQLAGCLGKLVVKKLVVKPVLIND